MAPERRAILQRCSLASITPVWMVMVADRYLCFGLAVALAARSLAGCYFPRGCCVSACTSRGMKHSMGQLTFCREGRKAVSALSREGRHLWGGGTAGCQPVQLLSFVSTKQGQGDKDVTTCTTARACRHLPELLSDTRSPLTLCVEV